MKYLSIPLTCLFLVSFSLPGQAGTEISKARELFDSGRYWDAYMECKNTGNGDSDFTTLSLLEDSKKAMVIQQKYRIYRDMKQYPRAIEKLEDLLRINPKDPDRHDVGLMSYLHARQVQKQALNQYLRVEAENKFSEAVTYYKKALQEGVPSAEILPKLKLCEKQLNQVKPLDSPEISVDAERIPVFTEKTENETGIPANDIPRERKVIILDEK